MLATGAKRDRPKQHQGDYEEVREEGGELVHGNKCRPGFPAHRVAVYSVVPWLGPSAEPRRLRGEALVRIETLVPRLRKLPGFAGYYLIEAGNDFLISLGLFERPERVVLPLVRQPRRHG